MDELAGVVLTVEKFCCEEILFFSFLCYFMYFCESELMCMHVSMYVRMSIHMCVYMCTEAYTLVYLSARSIE